MEYIQKEVFMKLGVRFWFFRTPGGEHKKPRLVAHIISYKDPEGNFAFRVKGDTIYAQFKDNQEHAIAQIQTSEGIMAVAYYYPFPFENVLAALLRICKEVNVNRYALRPDN